MKTFKFQKISQIVEEITLSAESLAEAQERAEESDCWDSDGPFLVKEQYKVVESSGDIYLDSDNLMDTDYIVTFDANSSD